MLLIAGAICSCINLSKLGKSPLSSLCGIILSTPTNSNFNGSPAKSFGYLIFTWLLVPCAAITPTLDASIGIYDCFDDIFLSANAILAAVFSSSESFLGYEFKYSSIFCTFCFWASIPILWPPNVGDLGAFLAAKFGTNPKNCIFS